MGRLIELPWDGQPQEASWLDLGEAAAARTVFFAAFNEQRNIRDLVRGYSLANPGGDGVGTEGRVATFNGSQQGIVAWTPPVADTTGDTLVVCGRILATAAQAGTPGSAFCVAGSTGTQLCMGIGFDPSNNVGCAVLNGTSAYLDARSPGVLNRWYTVFAKMHLSGAGLSSRTFSAWINGRPATTGQDTERTGSAGALDEIAVGAQHRSAGFLRQFRGHIAWASVIQLTDNTEFDDAAAWRLYSSGYPWTMYEPRRIDLPTGAAPSGLPTLAYAAPADITATSFRPRVSYAY